MFSIAQVPPKQSVGETITVLSGRLASSTLLEDRRAAIQGLRSFAKDYPASVSSGALRSLIGCLRRDGEDIDTVKVVLETLLMLFAPNESSAEASPEIFLWLADEFTQRQDNITLLLDFIEAADFYGRLYSLQLLAAILAARPQRTEECILTAPLGVARLVAVLAEEREAVRGEAVQLLIALTPTSVEMQKLVAFENVYERLFAVMDVEGGLVGGSRAVEDCFILMANLLRENPSNQALFRESGWVQRLTQLLETSYRLPPTTTTTSSSTTAADDMASLAPWAQTQMNRNVYGLLAVARLFLVPGTPTLTENQRAFVTQGFVFHALQLAFAPATDTTIRAEALCTCADAIRGHAPSQETFPQMSVTSPLVQLYPERADTEPPVYIVDALVEVILQLENQVHLDVRLAACECIKAYFYRHNEIRLFFLERALEGHREGGGGARHHHPDQGQGQGQDPSGHGKTDAPDDNTNVLSILLRPPNDVRSGKDPYLRWFAATITFHLVHDYPTAKRLIVGLVEGDEAHGEEVVTAVQTLAAHFITGLSRAENPRVLVAYAMLLLGLVYEDVDAVNEFLREGSNVQALIQASQQSNHDAVIQGLCVMLMGVLYEFATKDSPIPRADLERILTSRLGADRFRSKLGRLRSHPLMRDFEILPQKQGPDTGTLPDVFFDRTFVDFFKDNYNRIYRALEREADVEASILVDGVERGVSRALVDELREAVAHQTQKVAEATRQWEEEREAHGRTQALLQQQRQDVGRSQAAWKHEAARHQQQAAEEARAHAAALQRSKVEHEQALQRLTLSHEAALLALQQQLAQAKSAQDDELRRVRSAQQAQLAEAATAAEATAARTLQKAKEEWQLERQRLASERDTLSSERDALRAAKDSVSSERDTLSAERDTLLAERDTLSAERDSLSAERDSLSAERDTISAERDTLLAERDTLLAERDSWLSEKQTILLERDTLQSDKDQLSSDNVKLAAEAKRLRAEVQGVEDRVRDSDKARQTAEAKVQSLEREKGELVDELARARQQVVEAAAQFSEEKKALVDQLAECQSRVDQLAREKREWHEKHQALVAAQTKAGDARTETEGAASGGGDVSLAAQLEEARAAERATHSELDDLLIVLGDLEDKAARYKQRLLALGEDSEGDSGDGEDSGEDSEGEDSEGEDSEGEDSGEDSEDSEGSDDSEEDKEDDDDEDRDEQEQDKEVEKDRGAGKQDEEDRGAGKQDDGDEEAAKHTKVTTRDEAKAADEMKETDAADPGKAKTTPTQTTQIPTDEDLDTDKDKDKDRITDKDSQNADPPSELRSGPQSDRSGPQSDRSNPQSDKSDRGRGASRGRGRGKSRGRR